MKGAHRAVQQTGSAATDSEKGVTGAFTNLPGTNTLVDFLQEWEAFDFVRDVPVFNDSVGPPCTAQQKYELELLDLIRRTCEAMVDIMYPEETDTSLQSDPEVIEWFEMLRQKLPSMYPILTKKSLKEILYRFHASVVFHDMSHVIPTLVNVGDLTKPGNVLSLVPSKYEQVVQAQLYQLVQEERSAGMSFGFFWSDLFQQDPQYQAILDDATCELEELHTRKYPADEVRHVGSTILM